MRTIKSKMMRILHSVDDVDVSLKERKMVSLLTNWIFQTFDEFKKSLKTALLCSQRRHSLPQFNSFMSKAKSLGSQCRSFNKIRLVLEVIQTCFCFCYMLINMTLQFQFHTPIDFLSSFPSKGVNIKSCMVAFIDQQ